MSCNVRRTYGPPRPLETKPQQAATPPPYRIRGRMAALFGGHASRRRNPLRPSGWTRTYSTRALRVAATLFFAVRLLAILGSHRPVRFLLCGPSAYSATGIGKIRRLYKRFSPSSAKTCTPKATQCAKQVSPHLGTRAFCERPRNMHGRCGKQAATPSTAYQHAQARAHVRAVRTKGYAETEMETWGWGGGGGGGRDGDMETKTGT